MIHVQIEDLFQDLITDEPLISTARKVLDHETIDPDSELTIVIETDEKLQQLNRDFLGFDAPTDVLSFPSDEFDPDEQAAYIGDIIISYPRAEIQAKAAGHSTISEIQLLVVHGTLHLIGYDHAEPDEKADMWAVQAEILVSLGVRINKLPE